MAHRGASFPARPGLRIGSSRMWSRSPLRMCGRSGPRLSQTRTTLGRIIDHTLIEHWDGSSWTVVPSPNHSDSSSNYFWAVSASSPTNVWALGQWTTESAYGNAIQRWDGDAWQIVEHPFGDFPIPGGDTTNFWNLAALSPTNVWFAGYYVESASNLLPVLKHWDGSSWQDVDVQASGQLIDITASSARDIWMLGTNNSSTTSFGQHWDGTKAAAFPNAQGQQVQFEFGRSLTALPSGEVWAVGNVDSGVYVQHLCPIPVSDGGAGLASTSTPDQAQPVTSTTRVRLGGGVAWKFSRQNQGRHRVADASGMALFDSGLRAGGGSYTRLFKIAGAFPWVDPTTSRHGTVRTLDMSQHHEWVESDRAVVADTSPPGMRIRRSSQAAGQRQVHPLEERGHCFECRVLSNEERHALLQGTSAEAEQGSTLGLVSGAGVQGDLGSARRPTAWPSFEPRREGDCVKPGSFMVPGGGLS